MRQHEPVSQLLYVSRLSTGLTSGVVKDIVRVARRHNPSRAITGALLFNGDHFCQLLEGPPESVRELMQRIAQDARHTDVRTLFFGTSADGARMAPRWRSGYCEPSAFEVFEVFEVFDPAGGANGLGAIEAFARLIPDADLE